MSYYITIYKKRSWDHLFEGGWFCDDTAWSLGDLTAAENHNTKALLYKVSFLFNTINTKKVHIDPLTELN